MVKNVKNVLESIHRKNDFIENQEIFVQNLNDLLQEETFGNKVNKALNQKKQGHFNKAMLNISELNRDQVLSIITIQSIIDKFNDSSKTDIVFEKFRQFYPFQIGLRNGKDVLELLNLIKLNCGFNLDNLVTDLHKNEEIIESLLLELNFFETRMKGGISEDEINELKRNIKNITEKIFEIKLYLIDCACEVVQKKYIHIPIEYKISLIKNIYLIISSSIQTLDANFIEVT